MTCAHAQVCGSIAWQITVKPIDVDRVASLGVHSARFVYLSDHAPAKSGKKRILREKKKRKMKTTKKDTNM